MKIRFMEKADLDELSEVHAVAFPRQQDSRQWLECNLRAAPRFLNLVAEVDGKVVGYIIWVQKSGFRAEAVLELEQLAVSSKMQGQGIGRHLIKDSLPLVQEQLSLKCSTIKHILVTTRADNYAQKLYQSALGAKVECLIPNLYSADEVLMIARNVEI